MVRLKFDDVEKPPPRPKKTPKEPQQKKRRKFTDKDFDSEEEYGQGKLEDESDVEYDDGKPPVKPEDDSDVEYDDGKGSDGASLESAGEADEDGSSDDEDEGSDEEGEAEMSEEDDKVSKDSYIFEKEGEDQPAQLTKSKQQEAKDEPSEEPKARKGRFTEVVDHYRIDPFLVRREATLLLLALKSFGQRVIVFCNEKKQCNRLHTLFTMFGLKAVQVQGNMNQLDRMEAVEKFQRGEVDFLLATDLVARGLDISAVKTVLNFTFPIEPKRYLHRVGRTARAGSHGVALTLCNDEERKDIKKLIRKLNQNLTTYMVPPKLVKQLHDFITDTLDPVIREIELEQIQDKELQQAYREAERAENLVKFKDEIQSRPKNEWHKSVKQKKEVQKESRKELSTIRSKFDEYSTQLGKE